MAGRGPVSSSTVELMVTVKAYPNLTKHGERVCVAGIRTDLDDGPKWVRLFPIPFRDLPFAQRFEKYQIIRLQTSVSRKDKRPESLLPIVDSLELVEDVIPSKDNWKKRMVHIEPLMQESMCEIISRQKVDGTSLGAFRPAEVSTLKIDPVDEGWNPSKQALADQPSLLMPTKVGLKKIPYQFTYKYRCSHSACKGHEQSIIDWEIDQAFLNWREIYGADEALDHIRKKWLDQICGDDRDTIFYVGNQHQHPGSFLVLGTVWPKMGPDWPKLNLTP